MQAINDRFHFYPLANNLQWSVDYEAPLYSTVIRAYTNTDANRITRIAVPAINEDYMLGSDPNDNGDNESHGDNDDLLDNADGDRENSENNGNGWLRGDEKEEEEDLISDRDVAMGEEEDASFETITTQPEERIGEICKKKKKTQVAGPIILSQILAQGT